MTLVPLYLARIRLWAGCCFALAFSHAQALGQAAPSDRKADDVPASVTFTNLARGDKANDTNPTARRQDRLETRIEARISTRVTRETALSGLAADAAAAIRLNEVKRQANADKKQPND